MKKLLGLFGSLSLLGTTSATVVSCNDVADFGYYSSKILSNLDSENVVDSQNLNYNMSWYFDELNNLYVKGNQDNLDKVKSPITLDILKEAVDIAIENIVTSSTEENDFSVDLTYTQNSTDSKKALTDEILSSENIDIHIAIKSKDNSKKWKGSTEINFKSFANSTKSNGGIN